MPAPVEPVQAEHLLSNGIKKTNGVNGTTAGKDEYSVQSTELHDHASHSPAPIISGEKSTLDGLYSASAVAKIWGVALRDLDREEPPVMVPEYTEPQGTQYIYSSVDFWTSGFFPGCLYLLRERQRRWPSRIGNSPHPLKLQHAGRWWTANLHRQASRTDTHDLGFMIQPWAKIGWEIDKDIDCFNSLVTAAHALASRFDPKVGCIRSWDTCFTKRYAFGDPSKDFLVIIDNMMNLDMLYYVADLTNNTRLAEIATTHALTTLSAHIRPDNSTCHVVNYEQADGTVKERMTNQGYSDTSCWARGQAWGIVGFAQSYRWTKKPEFLDASQRLADYFVERLPHDYVPYWDFDAPQPGPRDTSAALVAAYGMLLLHQAIEGDKGYLQKALRLIEAVVSQSLAPEACFVRTSRGDEAVDLGGPETIVLNATINNYEFAPRRWADHGLVYADYYFLLTGNELLRMGLA